jgi:acetolactate synthase-1/2/3 large subunit
MSVTGAELLVKALADRGVGRVYGLHGGHLQRIIDFLPDYGIDFVTTRDERAAAYMAHAHYQITGEPGVAFATAGPGVTNALTGVANAQSYEAPILLVGGSASLKQQERIALQELEQVDLYEPITEWAGTVYEAERMPEYVDLAMRKARRPRPGPAFLNVPMDVQNEKVPDEWLEAGRDVVQEYSAPDAQRPQPGADATARLVTALEEAERPVVISGVGVMNSGVGDTLQEFVEAAGVPYLDTAESRGYVPGDHPMNVNAARSKVGGEADTIVLLGKRLDFTLAFGSDVFFNPDATLVQVDADESEIGRNRPIDVPVVGDERATLEHLLEEDLAALTRGWDDGWIGEVREADASSREELEERLATDAEPIHPWRLCGEVRDRIEEDAYVACDGGDILSFGRIALDVKQPRHWLTSGPFGCLGATVAQSIAAALLEPDSQVVCLIGDGSFGFDALELDTAARYDADVTFVVANNAAWNIDRFDQKEQFDRIVGTELQATRYDLLAEAVGGHGERVEAVDELGPALDRAIEYAGPAVVNVVIDRDAPSPDFQQGMQSHGNHDMPDLQLLKPWDEAERDKRGQPYD